MRIQSPATRSDHGPAGLVAGLHGRGQYATRPGLQDGGGRLAEAQRQPALGPGLGTLNQRASVEAHRRWRLGCGLVATAPASPYRGQGE
jgi:hypothetical protein